MLALIPIALMGAALLFRMIRQDRKRNVHPEFLSRDWLDDNTYRSGKKVA